MYPPTHPNFQMAIDRNIQAPAPPMGTAASWIWNFEPSKRKTGQYPVSPRKHRGITLVSGKIIEILELSMFSDPVDMSNLKALQMDTSIKPSQAEVLWLTHITLTDIPTADKAYSCLILYINWYCTIPGVLSHIMVSLVANGSTFSKKPVLIVARKCLIQNLVADFAWLDRKMLAFVWNLDARLIVGNFVKS